MVHVPSIVKAENGERGKNKDCHGKDAEHKIVKVPVGTIVKNSAGKIVGDLAKEGTMFVAARGGAGGKGNHFFASNNEQAPQVCEHGAHGEDIAYITELRSMAHLGLVRNERGAYVAIENSIVKCSLLDWLTECWQKYIVALDYTCSSEGCTICIHHTSAACRHRSLR